MAPPALAFLVARRVWASVLRMWTAWYRGATAQRAVSTPASAHGLKSFRRAAMGPAVKMQQVQQSTASVVKESVLQTRTVKDPGVTALNCARLLQIVHGLHRVATAQGVLLRRWPSTASLVKAIVLSVSLNRAVPVCHRQRHQRNKDCVRTTLTGRPCLVMAALPRLIARWQ